MAKKKAAKKGTKVAKKVGKATLSKATVKKGTVKKIAVENVAVENVATVKKVAPAWRKETYTAALAGLLSGRSLDRLGKVERGFYDQLEKRQILGVDEKGIVKVIG